MFISTLLSIASAILLCTAIVIIMLFIGLVIILSYAFQIKERDVQRIFEYLSVTVTSLLLLFVATLLLKGIVLTVLYCGHYVTLHQWGIA